MQRLIQLGRTSSIVGIRSIFRRILILLAGISSALILPGSTTAQQAGQPPPGIGTAEPNTIPEIELNAMRLTGAIELDGRILEDFWSSAVPITDFTQQEPVEGGVPSEETEIRVLFDEDNLYIGVIIYDDPEEVLAYQRERDAMLSTDDRFMWILDTFLDGRTGYFFEINAAGLMGDGILRSSGGGGGGRFGGGSGGGGTNKAWDGIWEARTAMRPDGWSAEIRIPFRTLNFDPDNDTWGINFQRTIRRRNEEILWRGWKRTEGLRRPIYAGRMTGLQNLSQGLGLEAVPSTIVGWRSIPANAEPTTVPRELSLDVNYSVTSSLRASLSVNTDFAEVESDQRRVNLTRFPMRFPERRNFFLEGSNVFSFAPRSGPSPFYSRNIGLRSGQQIPINYGGRVTGQVGEYEVGFYQLGTSDHEYLDGTGTDRLIPSEQFTVGRIKRQIFEQSTIGAVYTRRAQSPDALGESPLNAYTAGADLLFRTRNLAGRYNMDVEATVVWNSNPDPAKDLEFKDLAGHGLKFTFPNDTWSGSVGYRELGSGYQPALGFIPRNDFRAFNQQIGWSPRPNIDWIRRLRFSAQFRHQKGVSTGITDEGRWEFGLLGLDLESGDGFDINATRKFEYLDRAFFVSEGVKVMPGEYTTLGYRLSVRTTGRRPVSVYGNASLGDFWNGERLNFGGRVTFRPNPGVSISTNIQHNRVTLPQGDFVADVYEVEGQWNPTPWVSAMSQVQFDDVSELVGLFARLRWIVKPGNDIYFVYTHNWQNLGVGILDNPDLITLSRGGSIKANYTYRF